MTSRRAKTSKRSDRKKTVRSIARGLSTLAAFGLFAGLLSLPLSAFADTAGHPTGLLAGKVREAASPISAARVYTYKLSDLSLRKVTTDSQGAFHFEGLPAGLYKVIAHKSGFVPVVVMLARGSAAADQFVELELLAEPNMPRDQALDFWKVRQQIPTDVLRELGLDREEARRHGPTAVAEGSRTLPSVLAGVQAEMQALAGVDDNPYRGESHVSGGRLGLDGSFGGTQVDFEGYYLEMENLGGMQNRAATSAVAHQSAMSLELRGEGASRVNVESRMNSMTDNTDRPIDFERYQVSWSTPLGARGQSAFSAQYTSENNFYRPDWVGHTFLPDSSRTLRLRGSYARQIGANSTMLTELRYREREIDDLIGFDDQRFARESVEVLSQAGWRIQPAVLVEYGMMTKLRDGSLSVTPRGGLVLQLNEAWQAAATVSRRLHDEDPGLYQDFVPALFQQSTGCDSAEEACYKLALTRNGKNDQSFTLGALHRELGETLRLLFDEDFFNHLESLYLVRGDELPEVQLAVTHRLSPSILTRLESNLSSGGGGLVVTESDDVLENKVRYLVTSLDTQFQETSTGVYVAFHQLQQELEATNGLGASSTQLDLERFQLKVTQDLSFLAALAADWTVHLDMEVSRGKSPLDPESDEDELRKRILGGLAVRF